MLLLGSGATIIVLLVVISTMASTDDPPAADVSARVPGASVPPSPLPSVDPGARPPPPPTVRGCTEPNAQNYDRTATTNDGSCRYPPPSPARPAPSVSPRPPPAPCVDDANCDQLISLLGCTHDLHGSDPQIPIGVVRPSFSFVVAYFERSCCLNVRSLSSSDGSERICVPRSSACKFGLPSGV